MVLTAYHNIEKLVDNNGNLLCGQSVNVGFYYVLEIDDNLRVLEQWFETKKIYIEEKSDLALIQIKPGIKFNYSKLIDYEVDLAEEVYIMSHPNLNYRSIVKGVISSKNRYSNMKKMYQISGGVIYGSSGGGAFTKGGRLIGIAKAVDFNGPFMIYYIGYFITPETIKNFLLSTEFSDKFSYIQ